MGATDTITLNRILTTAAGWHASDLHFVVGSQPIVRVDGKLTALGDEQIISQDFIEMVAGTFLSESQRQQLLTAKEVTSAYSLNPQVRFKVMAFYQRGSLAISLHFIPTRLPRLTELGLPPEVEKFAALTRGLVLITGPYGSGRTTTMNAIVNEINERRAVNIVIVEQPIEYLFVNNQSMIEQREVGRDALSAEQAIIAASKEDVEVVVVSEAGGASVLGAMLDAAEASRLVISTTNTDSVLSTIEKIINSFPADAMPKVRVQLANVLAGIISQRLLPKANGGQVLLAEIMIPTPPVRAVIRDGALVQLANTLQTSREPGMVSLDRGLAALVQNGTVKLEDALLHATDQNVLRSMTQPRQQ